ncbi:MAG: hypothetical protein GXY54_12245, partial [Deltaproteobacteria bacterium]|nr:hypothetical protein [Deltaproteobacteria bacterium]
GAAAAQFNNKVEVATYYTLDHWGQDTELSALQAVIANVTDDDATVAAAIAAIDGEEPGEVPPFYLTELRDNFSDAIVGGVPGTPGSGGDDLFIADVIQNYRGAQVNTLGTGDLLDGKGGHDTLEAQLTEGVYEGGGNMPVTPRTYSIETVLIDALNAHINSGYYYDDGIYETNVYLNAENMNGVETIGSWHSEANLVIQNMTTKYSDGTGARALNEMTVVMGYTGSRDSHWAESDLSVYFDPDYLIPTPISTQPTIDLLVMNEDAYDETYDLSKAPNNQDQLLPLVGVFLRQLHFNLNGVEYDLDQYVDEDPDGAGDEIQTYADLLAAIQAAIVELKADNPGDAALQTLQAELGDAFLTDISPVLNLQRVGQTIRLTVDGITNDQLNTLTIESQQLEVARAAASEYENNNRYERAIDDPSVQDEELTINVDLEKVGLLGDGGELVIGAMSKPYDDNEWNDSIRRPGIDKFIVTVYGDEDKPSSLAGLRSTNNALREVTVATDPNQTESFADLTIGNSNTWGRLGTLRGNQNALKDVRVFDASEFKGDLTLYAALTEEVAAKYMDLQDEQDDPAADDISFEYTGGTGNDFFDIAIDDDNFAYDGGVTREDFVLHVDGNDGDDEIVVHIDRYRGLADDGSEMAFLNLPMFPVPEQPGDDNYPGDIGDGLFLPWFFASNWYDNQSLIDDGDYQINIYGGDGDDIIRTPGAGDANIYGGNGDDAIYVDNTGEKAVWVFNAAEGFPWARMDIDNLQSDANNQYQLYKATMQITFKGFESCACPIEQSLIPSTNGWTSDLQINQTIKKIINNDDVLSKLLVAKDGPGNTLVVESKIDGLMLGTDLDIQISPPSDLSPLEISQLNGWYGTNLNSVGAFNSNIFNPSIAAIDAKGDYDGWNFAWDDWAFDMQLPMVGFMSFYGSDNVVTAGADDFWYCSNDDECGGDVIVLGTGLFSNDTVRYEGFENGYDTVVNFNTYFWGDYTLKVPASGVLPGIEYFTATFGDYAGDGDDDISLPGGVTITDPSAGEVVAAQMAQAANDLGYGGWEAFWIEGTNEVIFYNFGGDLADGDTDFNQISDIQDLIDSPAVQAVLGNLDITISDYVNGDVQIGQQAWAVLDLNDTTIMTDDGSFTFNVGTVNYEVGDGPMTLAAKLTATEFDDWQVLNPGFGYVIFLAKENGEVDLGDLNTNLNTAAVDAITDGLVANWGSTFAGVDEDPAGQVVYRDVTFEGLMGDWLDFSWYTEEAGNGYDAVGVYVNGRLIAGRAAGSGEQVVHLVDDATPLDHTPATPQDGEYNIYLQDQSFDEIALIGRIDFGVSMDDNPFDVFHYLTADNIILA